MSNIPSREEALFADALAQPQAQRGAFLVQACGDNLNLLSHLIALLAAHEGPESLMVPAFPSRPAPTPEEKAGERIGRYKLLQKIGEGGCGVVWMAEQEEPVRRRVALKVIKLGMDTKAVIARFEAERQALAMMDHPNIAKVLDGGATEAGRPYFVMELVRGIPITQFCDDQNLPTRQRLELAIKVCHAIQHAHQKGIIHRDIKPSNVLVTLHDDDAVPMVIDFGIAKATQGRLTDQTLFTAFEQFLGTPVYMSPEQAEFNALDVDTRSDIYSLGVLLYELLTGRPPFDPKALREAGIDQIRRIIREDEPPRPSNRVRTLTDAERTTVAKRRSTAPAQLSTLLRGDLDWIVLKALDKNRVRRYQTANAFAVDIQHSLANEVVAARPPSTLYRIRKAVSRNKAGFVAAAAIAALLIGGLAFSTISFLRERAERDRAVEAQRLEAKRASQNDVVFATRLLDEDKVSDGLAYLVRAARRDPTNPIVAPRLLTTLVDHNFFLPEGASLRLPSPPSVGVPLRYSSDGRALFLLCEDGVVRTIDTSTWRMSREFRFDQKIAAHGMSLARDNDRVLAASLEDGSIVVCDTDNGAVRPRLLRPKDAVVGGTLRPVVSPDGRWVAAGQGQTVWVWNAETGSLHATVPSVSGFVLFTPDSQCILTNVSRKLQRWSVTDGSPIGPQIGPETPGSPIQHRAVEFSADGRSIAVCYYRSAQIFDVETGTARGPELALGIPQSSVTNLLFTPDGLRLIAASQAKIAQVIDVATGQPVFPPLAHDGPVSSLQLNRDGKVLLTRGADGFARLWDMENGKLLAQPTLQQNQSVAAALAPDSTNVIIVSARGVAYRLPVLRGVREPLTLSTDNSSRTLFLPQAPSRVLRLLRDRVSVIAVSSGREAPGSFPYPDAECRVTGGYFSADRRTTLVLDAKRVWRVWKRGSDGTVEKEVTIEGGGNLASYAILHPSGDFVAIQISGPDGGVGIWSTETGRRLSLLQGYTVVAFGGDGHSLVLLSALDSRLVQICDFPSCVERFTLREPVLGRWFRSAKVSPDGKHVITGDNWGRIKFWSATDGRLIQAIDRHCDDAYIAGFSPDGRFLLTRSTDGTVQMWNLAAASPVGSLLGHASWVTTAAFTPDGQRIVTGTLAGHVRIWDAMTSQSLTEPMRAARGTAIFNIEFSPDGRFFLTMANEGEQSLIWPMPPAGGDGPVPAWLLRLATVCASKRLTDEGEFVSAADDAGNMDEIRRQIEVMPEHEPFAAWARWFVADRATRSISPGFNIMPSELKKLAGEVESSRPLAEMLAREKLLREHGNFAEAEALERQALKLARQSEGEDSISAKIVRTSLCWTLLKVGKLEEAESLARPLLENHEMRFPAADDIYAANLRGIIGAALVGQKRYAEAEAFLVRACETMRQANSRGGLSLERKSELNDHATALGQLYQATNRPEKAAEWRANTTERSDDPAAAPGREP